MTEIVKNLLIGDLEDAEHPEHLYVDIVINLSETSLHDPSGSIIYINIPMIDTDKFPIHKYFDYIEAIVETALNDNQRVLINCRMGLSRSVISYAMILMRMFPDMPYNRALEIIKSKKKIDPNFGFVEQLEKYGRG